MISILLLLISGVCSTSYTVNNVTFNIDLAASTTIYSSDGADKCNRIVPKTSQLYHLSSEGAFESWPLSTLAPQTNSVTSVLSGATIHDMDVSDNELRTSFVTSNPTSGRLVNTMNPDNTINSQTTYLNPYESIYVATDGTNDYILAVDSIVTSATHIYVMQGNTVLRDISMSLVFTHMAVSPDFQTAVVWEK
jgi:hypothetical protein